MIQAMYSGIAGMKAFKSSLDVVGNNIANVSTTGFKSGKASFKEMMSQTLSAGSAPSGGRGGSNATQVGLGVTLAGIDQDMGQGSMTSTGRKSDCAIEGNGYFAVSNGSRSYFTRDGAFTQDSQYNLVTSSGGMKVLGWSADPLTGAIDTTAAITQDSSIQIPVGTLALAAATTNASLGGNLSASAATGDTYSLKFDVYDSLGMTHALKVTFTKQDSVPGTSSWTYDFDATPSTVPPPSPNVLEFDSNGYATSATALTSIPMTLSPSTGAPETLTFNLDMSKVTNLNGSNTIDMNSQDGLPMGTLESYTIDKGGRVVGQFTNGVTKNLAQVSMVTFNNANGLTKIGGNLLTESAASGTARYSTAGSGSLGTISSGFLEASNVDLTNEFSNMIVAQRGFQANSKIISTSDEILQELANLKR
jgi:flagellar hook protein FlgE